MTQAKKIKEIKYISPIATTYGKAIVDVGFTLSDITYIRELLQNNLELLDVLSSPAINIKEKHQLIDRIFSLDHQDDLKSNFLKVLLNKNRFYLLDEILQAAWEILQAKNYTVTAKLRYVTMPTTEQLSKMERILIDKLNCRKVQWDFCEDPKLLGGFQLEAGELYFDYSIKGCLDEMKKNITGR